MSPSVYLKLLIAILLVSVRWQSLLGHDVANIPDNAQEFEYSVNTVERIYLATSLENHEPPTLLKEKHQKHHLQQQQQPQNTQQVPSDHSQQSRFHQEEPYFSQHNGHQQHLSHNTYPHQSLDTYQNPNLQYSHSQSQQIATQQQLQQHHQHQQHHEYAGPNLQQRVTTHQQQVPANQEQSVQYYNHLAQQQQQHLQHHGPQVCAENNLHPQCLEDIYDSIEETLPNEFLLGATEQHMLQRKTYDYQVMNSETRIWKSKSSPGGEIEGLYINTYESISVDPNGQYHIVHQHADHIRHINTNINGHHQAFNHHHSQAAQGPLMMNPMGSCSPVDPASIMHPLGPNSQQTCHASLVSSNPSGQDPIHSGNQVPRLPSILGDSRTSHNSNVDFSLLSPNQYPYESSLISAIRHYWREVFALCLISAVCLNWVFAILKRRFNLVRTELTEEPTQQQSSRSSWKDTASSLAQDSAFDETAPSLSLGDLEISQSSLNGGDKCLNGSPKSLTPPKDFLNVSGSIRQRSSTLKAEPIPIPSSRNRLSSQPTSQSNPASLSNSLNSNEYNSRYSSDFDSIRRLGRGGFGVVFEAKNKIDDCHYAIKRICLPLEKEGRERVMREVRALAKLDHAGIVRYYNAWLESPPDEWLKQHDAQFGVMQSNDGGLPSTDGIYEKNDSEAYSKYTGDEINCGYGDEDCLDGSGDKPFNIFGQNSKLKQRLNGFKNKLLRNNSSSPSLDIVFEGSGSIRLESENCTEKTDSSLNSAFDDMIQGDSNINGDGEDNDDFIQFESRSDRRRQGSDSDSGSEDENDDLNDLSVPSYLSEPFSSSSSSGSEFNNASGRKPTGTNGLAGNSTGFKSKNGDKRIEEKVKASINHNKSLTNHQQNRLDRKKILGYQKDARLLSENLHTEKAYLYIQMQLCHKETLRDWLKTNCERRDPTEIMNLFYQIADAVEYVHSQDLIHRDLKPSNIFFSLDRTTVKIGDFGLCRAKTSTSGIGSSIDLQEYVSHNHRGCDAVHTEQVGTQLYMSPEQLSGLSYNQKVDIFAMGLILLELLIPFKTQMQRVNVLFKARNNLYSDEFISAHKREHELVKSLLNRSPLKRPTASEIKQHDLLANAQLSQPVIERINQRRRTISSNSSNE